jgi:hypothetical protein
MFILEAPLDRGLHPHRDIEVRVAALRRQIALYRQQLRQSFNPDFTAIYGPRDRRGSVRTGQPARLGWARPCLERISHTLEPEQHG